MNKHLRIVNVRSPRRGCEEITEKLRSSELKDQGFEIYFPSTNLTTISSARKGILSQDLFPAGQLQNTVFLIFGGDGTHHGVKKYARDARLNVIYMSSTHDHGLSVFPENELGYQSAIDCIGKLAMKFFNDATKPRILIVPGREKNGLAWEIFELVKEFHPTTICAKTRYEMIAALNRGKSVIISEAVSIEYGADLKESITDYPLVGEITKDRDVSILPKDIKRITGPDLEELDYQLTEVENEIIDRSTEVVIEVAEHFALGNFSKIPEKYGRHLALYYQNAGAVLNLTGHITREMNLRNMTQ